MTDVALEVPGRTVPVGGLAKGDDTGLTWTQMLDNPFDCPVLAGCISPFQNNQDLVVAFDEVPLQLDEVDLELRSLPL